MSYDRLAQERICGPLGLRDTGEGGTGGFRSFAAVAPAANVGVVVLANDTRPGAGSGCG